MPDSPSQKTNRDAGDEFARQAEEPQAGLIREFWDFLLESKMWWLTPIFLVMLLLGVLVVLSGTAAAPFIYTLW